jgi:DNA-binding NarL/FixJ family response regulator
MTPHSSKETPATRLEDSPDSPPQSTVLFSPRSPMPKRILIVEDEVSVRHAVRTFIEFQSQLEVCGEATNGVEALERAVALRPDLILLDLSMPIMNGVEVASLLRARMPNIPVVVYTMFDDVLGKPLAASLGIAAIVSKSDGLTKLLARIEALLASNSLVQPPVV